MLPSHQIQDPVSDPVRWMEEGTEWRRNKIIIPKRIVGWSYVESKLTGYAVRRCPEEEMTTTTGDQAEPPPASSSTRWWEVRWTLHVFSITNLSQDERWNEPPYVYTIFVNNPAVLRGLVHMYCTDNPTLGEKWGELVHMYATEQAILFLLRGEIIYSST
jgi:hypothetical protein